MGLIRPPERPLTGVDTMPVLSFHHPALLHAILALGSLQMAKYQGFPETASLKHYHMALRRIAKNVRSPERRTHPATLAATLLLGYFEIWSADHEKWCRHLLGARLIIKEIRFAEMARLAQALKRQKRQQYEQSRTQALYEDPFSEAADPQPPVEEVNPAFLTQITGMPVAYEQQSRVTEKLNSRNSRRRFTDREAETYENLLDLYWWYIKMDVYQSTLGNTKLL